jgi:hypothetical protein
VPTQGPPGLEDTSATNASKCLPCELLRRRMIADARSPLGKE